MSTPARANDKKERDGNNKRKSAPFQGLDVIEDKALNSLDRLAAEHTALVQQQQQSLVNRLYVKPSTKSSKSRSALYMCPPTQSPTTTFSISSLSDAKKTCVTLSRCNPENDPIKPMKRKQATSTGVTLSMFERKYAKDDLMLRYALQVIRNGSAVQRKDIPKGNNVRRIVQPEEDVLYLIYHPAPPCEFRNIYWLKTIDDIQMLDDHREFFSLSCHGFTHFKNGNAVEFIDVGSWVDEKRAFDHMTMMKGLQRIQQMLFFFSWKRKSIRAKHRRVQARLACSLFICHPIAVKILIKVRSICMEIEKESARQYLAPNTTYTLLQFASVQHERLKSATSVVKGSIVAICDAIFAEMGELALTNSKDRPVGPNISSFSLSLQAASLRERMFNFLRLIQFQVTGSVYHHLEQFLDDLCQRICGDSRLINNTFLGTQLNSAFHEENNVLVTNICDEISALTTVVNPLDNGEMMNEFVQRVIYKPLFEMKDVQLPYPVLYMHLKDHINFDMGAFDLCVSPTKTDAYETIHKILANYFEEIDNMPYILTDQRFSHVLTPFAPYQRKEFVGSMTKPSSSVLAMYANVLRLMNKRVDSCFSQVEAIRNEHLQYLNLIHTAKQALQIDEETDSEGSKICAENAIERKTCFGCNINATNYENARRTWGEFLQYINNAPPVIQVGFLLVDRQTLIQKLLKYVSTHIVKIEEALPGMYEQALTDLIHDTDGRIEGVTKIPTSFEDANQWLTHVTEMNPSHLFRKKFNEKCRNLEKLKALMKERGVVGQDVDYDELRKLEHSWDSICETLLACLERVQDRDSEHRRSFHDLAAKSEKHIHTQLNAIRKEFENMLSNNKTFPVDALQMKKSPSCVTSTTQTEENIVEQLERLVEMEVDWRNVMLAFADYEYEWRMQMNDQTSMIHVDATGRLANQLTRDQENLPSELLLRFVATSFDVKTWYLSWNRLQERWRNSPLVSVHPGTILDRVTQFRHRLVCASSTLSDLSSELLRSNIFDEAEAILSSTKMDELVNAFNHSIDTTLTECRVFQAVSSGAFTEDKWNILERLLGESASMRGSERESREQLTLKNLQNQLEKSGLDNMEVFLRLCDQCIVEAKLHSKMENARRRMDQILIQVHKENYSGRCEGLRNAISELEDIAMDVKLCLFDKNPALEELINLSTDIQRKKVVCEHLLIFQTKWHFLSELTKLHEADEFFTVAYETEAAKFTRTQCKQGAQEVKAAWQAFLNCILAWNDRVRRLFCTHEALVRRTPLPTNLQPQKPPKSAPDKAVEVIQCTLDAILSGFEGFDFDDNVASCQHGIKLLHDYMNVLRTRTPRLFCLSDSELLKLLFREDHIGQLQRSLERCYPQVTSFWISRHSKWNGSALSFVDGDQNGHETSHSRIQHVVHKNEADDTPTNGEPVSIKGITTPQRKDIRFITPVLKIGRIKFWFSRLEEEMLAMVRNDLKQAACCVANDTVTDNSMVCQVRQFNKLFPQSVLVALTLRFSSQVDQIVRNSLSTKSIEIHVQLEILSGDRETQVNQLLKLRLDPAKENDIDYVRMENMLLISRFHREILRHMIERISRNEEEEAIFFWFMQVKIRLCKKEIMQLIRSANDANEALSLHTHDIGKKRLHNDIQNIDIQDFSLSAHTAHVDLMMGTEFVGWNRIPIISPLTYRSSFAILSTVKSASMSLIAPYTVSKCENEIFELVASLCQFLMKPLLNFYCNLRMDTIDTLENRIQAAYALDGFLVIKHLLCLSSAMIRVVQVKAVEQFQICVMKHSSTANFLSHSRFMGPNAAIIVPLDGERSQWPGGIVASFQTPFRSVAIAPPSIPYLVEALLLLEGYTSDQVQEVNVVAAVQSLMTAEYQSTLGTNTLLLIQNVICESKHLRNQYQVIAGQDIPAAKRKSHKTSFLRRRSILAKKVVNEGNDFNVVNEQTIFKQAFTNKIEPYFQAKSSELLRTQFRSILAASFPLSNECFLVDNTPQTSEYQDVEDAVMMWYEASNLSANNDQVRSIMDMWESLQTQTGGIVYGTIGSGKSTCIKILHHALFALELAELQHDQMKDKSLNQDQDQPTNINDSCSPKASSELIVLNPHLLSVSELYGDALDLAIHDSPKGLFLRLLTSNLVDYMTKKCRVIRKWFLIDGHLEGSSIESLLELVGPSKQLRHPYDPNNLLINGVALEQVRIIFETVDLTNASPSTLANCWSICVPQSCISYQDILKSWRSCWEEKMKLPQDTRGATNMRAIFRTLDLLISSFCIQFIINEIQSGFDEVDFRTSNQGLRFGCISFNHMTQSTIATITALCFRPSVLERMNPPHATRLVFFSVLWGFGGHLNDLLKLKFEHFLRAKVKDIHEFKHIVDHLGSFFDSEPLGELSEHVYHISRQGIAIASSSDDSYTSSTQSPGSKREKIIYDNDRTQFLILPPSSASLIQLCRLLLLAQYSFLLIGPTASGKTSLLRWLLRINDEDEAAEMMWHASLDHRKICGILDWLDMPSAWFESRSCQDDSYRKVKDKAESNLFETHLGRSFVFVDDLGCDSTSVREDYFRLILDHHICYNREKGSLQQLHKCIGGAMRVNSLEASNERLDITRARFLRHFAVFQLPNYSKKDLFCIFRAKYQQHFPTVKSTDKGSRLLSSQIQHRAESALSMEESVLRASIDLSTEMCSLQQTSDESVSTAFAFNLHYLDEVLRRTLTLGSPCEVGTREQETSLLSLGKLHQRWMSELRNVSNGNFLWSAFGVNTSSDANSDSFKKVWNVLRMLSEKYFSVSLSTDPSLSSAVEIACFTIDLASSYSSISQITMSVAQLRDLLSGCASAASYSLARRHSSYPDNLKGQSVIDLTRRLLLQLTSTFSSPYLTSGGYKEGSLAAIEINVLLGSSMYVNQILHIVHALEQRRHLIITSRDCRTISERLIRFACELSKFQIKLIPIMNGSGKTLKEELTGVLHAVAVQNERIALFIDYREVLVQKKLHEDCSTDNNALLDLVRELCLCQVPSLVHNSTELRNSIAISFIQRRTYPEIITEKQIMTELRYRLQQNLRICLFDDGGHQETKPNIDALLENSVNTSALLDWMKSRASMQWFQLDTTRDAEKTMTEMADTTAKLLCRPESDNITVLSLVDHHISCLPLIWVRIHKYIMATIPGRVRTSEEILYWISFLKTFVLQYQKSVSHHRQEVRNRERALQTLEALRGLLPKLEERRCNHSATLHQLEIYYTNIENAFIELLHKQQELNTIDSEEEIAQIANVDYDYELWVLRSKCDEIAMTVAEVQTQFQKVTQQLAKWDEALKIGTGMTNKWDSELQCLRGQSNHLKVIAITCVRTVLMAYPFLSAHSPQTVKECIEWIKQVVQVELAVDPSESSSMITMDIVPENEIFIGDTRLARLLWRSMFSFMGNSSLWNCTLAADYISDRTPVFIDHTGLMQRFLIHFFSGHPFFSNIGDDKNIPWKSKTQESVVIMCDDPMFQIKLQDAQRRNVPVLLVNFQLDRTLPMLIPFLTHMRNHQRVDALCQLTKRSYIAHTMHHQAKQIPADSNKANITASTAGFHSIARNSIVNAAKIRQKKGAATLSSTVAVGAVAASVHRMSMTHHIPFKEICYENKKRCTQNALGFQLYAVTTTTISMADQHRLAADLAFFSVDLNLTSIEEFFRDVWIKKCRTKLHREIQDVQQAHVERKYRISQQKASLWYAVTESSVDFGALVHQLISVDRELRQYRSESFLFHERFNQLCKEADQYAWIGLEFANISRCSAVLSSLAGKSQLYSKSYRWFEFTIERILDSVDCHYQTDQVDLVFSHVKQALVQELMSGLMSKSHRQLLLFLIAIGREMQNKTDANNKANIYEFALGLLANDRTKWKHDDEDTMEKPNNTAKKSVCTEPTIAGTSHPDLNAFPSGISMVERLRHKIRPCAFVLGTYNSLGHSRSRSRINNLVNVDKTKQRTSKRQFTSNKTGVVRTQIIANAKTEWKWFLEKELVPLISSVQELRTEWKASITLTREALSRLLGYLGQQQNMRKRRSSMLMVDPSNLLVSQDDLFDKYGCADSVATALIFEQQLARLLITKMYFPSNFMDAFEDFLQSQSYLVDLQNAVSSKTILMNLSSAKPPAVVTTSTAALVADFIPPMGQKRLHLPSRFLIYDGRYLRQMELAVNLWINAGIRVIVAYDWDELSLSEQLLRCITGKLRFVVEIHEPEALDPVISLVSRLINQHALLSIPEWYILTSLTVAYSITSTKFSLIDRSMLTCDEGVIKIDTFSAELKRWLQEQGIPASVTTAVDVRRATGNNRSNPLPLCNNLRDFVAHFHSMTATDKAQNEKMLHKLVHILCAGMPISDPPRVEGENKDSSRVSFITRDINSFQISTHSLELLSDILLLGRSLRLVDKEGGHIVIEPLCQTTELADSHALNRFDLIFAQFRVLYHILSKVETTGEAAMHDFSYPWRSMKQEIDTHTSIFGMIDERLQSLRAETQREVLSVSTLRQLASLSDGLIPLEWVEAFTSVEPIWSTTVISIEQFLFREVCWITAVMNAYADPRTWSTLNLSLLSDTRQFLEDMLQWYASGKNISIDESVFVLELDPQMNQAEVFASEETDDSQKEEKDPALSWNGALLRDAAGFVDGIRVDGLVFIEQIRRSSLATAIETSLYPLPVCRLGCKVRAQLLAQQNETMRDAEEKAGSCSKPTEEFLPLIMLPSLSHYQQLPQLHMPVLPSSKYSLMLLNHIHVDFPLRAAVPMLTDLPPGSYESVKYAVGIAMFHDKDDHEEEMM